MTTNPHGRWLSIIGIGEDGVEGLLPAARNALSAASVVYGGVRHLALAEPLIRGETRQWPRPIEAAIPHLYQLRGQPVAVLASGDPFHFGIGSLLVEQVPVEETRSFPKPSSLSLAANRLGWALQDVGIVSLHGRPLSDLAAHLYAGRRLLALAWDGDTLAKVAGLLVAWGQGNAVLHCLEALDGPQERITRFTANEALHVKTDALTVIGLEGLSHPGRLSSLVSGLNDDRFAHDGQLTKAALRAAALSQLAPQPGERLWDIGSGSGSIAIEWLLADAHCTAIAIEKNEARIPRILSNAEALGAARLDLRHGEAPACLADLPDPDAIFIGGGVSDATLIDICIERLKPFGRLVAHAVTIEGEMRLMQAEARHGGRMSRTSIERLDTVGRFRAWKPGMAVVQWSFVKR